MSKTHVEIDFFEMERRSNASSKPSSPERSSSSFRGIQDVVSRINPQLLKTVMARSSDDMIPVCVTSSSPPASPSRSTLHPPPPVDNPPSTFSACRHMHVAPLTIFYNGTVVTTFDVPRHKALVIMRMAETGVDGTPAERPEDSLVDGNQVVAADLPIARRKSLQRFLEKRKERLVSASPYHSPR